MSKAVELDVNIADSPAETLNVYLGGVGVGRAGPADVASTMLILEVLLKVVVAANATPLASSRERAIVLNKKSSVRLMRGPRCSVVRK